MSAYYNDNDAACADWLRNLIAAGHLPAGDVDQRSIADIRPADLAGYTQCHFFAGIGGWPLALQLAGWSADRPVWTGSCPCQPFSCAGKRRGEADKRHLWPEFRRLIAECRPPVCFGEQVASKDGRLWLAGIRADLEALGYAVGAADLCAAGVGAPHIRQRLYWMADYLADRRHQGRTPQAASENPGIPGFTGPINGLAHAEGGAGGPEYDLRPGQSDVGEGGGSLGLADGERPGLEGYAGDGPDGRKPGRIGAEAPRPASAGGATGGLADAESDGGGTDEPGRGQEGRAAYGRLGAWSEFRLIPCRDGKARRIEPAPQQMADGFSESLGRLRPDTIAQIEKEIEDAAPGETSARQTLRDLWCSLAEEAVQWPSGGCHSLSEAPVLLAFLRELQREGWRLLDHLPSSCWESTEAGLRAMRKECNSAPRPSQGPKPGEQCAGQPCDSMRVLSQIITRAVERTWVMPHPLALNVPGRVVKLRAYGNAIVPPLAAEFILAALKALEGEPMK